MPYYNINPCSRKGNNQRRRQVSPDQFYFNPRSRRGTIIICVFGRNVKGFQSALLQGERPDLHVFPFFIILISIHVPAGGTTVFIVILFLYFYISIHVPAGGTTANISNIITQNNHTFISSIHSFEYHTAKSSPLPPESSTFCAIFPVRIPCTFHVCFTFALQK